MQTYISSDRGQSQNSSLKNSYNSYTRSWHSSKLNSFKFLVQVKLVQVFTRSWARKVALVHTRSWESRSWRKYAVLLCVVELFIHIKLHSQNVVLSAAFNQITKFWLSPIIFYSSGCPKMVDPTPMKVNWTQFLELQFDREELEGAGEHNFRGDTGGIKCTYHTLECSLKTSVVKIPKRKFFGIESLVQSCWHLWLWRWVKKSQFITYPTVSGVQNTWRHLEPLPYELVQVKWFPLW